MRVTIVGGGFGGVKAALEIAKDKKNHVTLITDRADFQYYPALYGTATGRSHVQSWIPLGVIFANRPNIDVIIDAVVSIDPKKRELTGESKTVYPYSTVILALGAVTTYFGIEGLDTYSYGIKSSEEIRNLKHHLYKTMFEDRQLGKEFVIIGAGPTGTELASSLHSYIERLRVDYRLPKRKIKISLIEAAPRVLIRMSETSSKRVEKRLKKLGVHVMTNQRVEKQTADSLIVNGSPIKSQTVIWTSGVANSPFYQANKDHFKFSANGKVVVDQYMRASKDVYVIGDNAFTPYSGLAQTALHDASFVARNFKLAKQRRDRKKYHMSAPPVVVPVGERWAVFEWKKIRVAGMLGALVRAAADFHGYNAILPLRQTFAVWWSQTDHQDDYFSPSIPLEKKS